MENSIPESEWKWFGFAAHFCLARRCEFHLTTQVGNKLISSVGGLQPIEEDNENRWEEIGCGRKFETLVFNIIDTESENKIPPIDYSEVESVCANTSKECHENHMRLCHKYANISHD